MQLKNCKRAGLDSISVEVAIADVDSNVELLYPLFGKMSMEIKSNERSKVETALCYLAFQERQPQ